MNISSINNHNIYFEAKNKKIRKADKIMRASKHTFPVVSSSYIDRFYSADKEPKSSLKNILGPKDAIRALAPDKKPYSIKFGSIKVASSFK